MGHDNFEDRTSFEEKYCDQCNSQQLHRVLSRWGVHNEEWKYEREIVAHCCNCFPYAAQKHKEE